MLGATKTCAICGQLIPAEAKRCPECQSWQSRWSRFWNPVNQSLGQQLVVMAVTFALLIPLLRFAFFPGTMDFEKYPDAIRFGDYSLSFSERENREIVAVVGTLKNSSDVVWRDIHVEARFMNSKGDMIDTVSEQLREVVLRKNGEAAFRVSAYTIRPKTEYSRALLVVTSARSPSWMGW